MSLYVKFSVCRRVFVGIVLTVAAGQSQIHAQAPAAFDVASVKPNNSPTSTMKFPFPSGGRFTATNISLKTLIAFAYKVQGFEISGGPAWISSTKYDIDARSPESNLTVDQYHTMLQKLLVDRFQLAVHRETKDVPGYALVAARNGPRLTASGPESCITYAPDSHPPQPAPGQDTPVACGGFFTGPSSLDTRGTSMKQFAGTLSIILGRPAVDKTGLPGTFDIHLEFSPDGTALDRRGSAGAAAPGGAGDSDNPKPSIFTALEQQLGLKLESQKQPVSILVIDRAEKASEN